MSPVTVTSLSSYIILQVLNKNRGYIKQIIATHSAKCKLFIANDYVHECNVIPKYHVCVQHFILYIKSFFFVDAVFDTMPNQALLQKKQFFPIPSTITRLWRNHMYFYIGYIYIYKYKSGKTYLASLTTALFNPATYVFFIISLAMSCNKKKEVSLGHCLKRRNVPIFL